MNNSIALIRERLPKEELLCQLAEECAELGKAALKLRRAYDGKNPTPVSKSDAYNNLIEEIADVAICLEVLDLNSPHVLFEVQKVFNRKMTRWAVRLEEMTCPVCGESVNPNDGECYNGRVWQSEPDDPTEGKEESG